MDGRTVQKMTGIDPLTISQTVCRGGSGAVQLSALPADEPAGVRLSGGPSHRALSVGAQPWRQQAGDLPVSIPASALSNEWLERRQARPVGEPAASVPMDESRSVQDDVALMLPPGRYGAGREYWTVAAATSIRQSRSQLLSGLRS